jgi:hypothetical protein
MKAGVILAEPLFNSRRRRSRVIHYARNDVGRRLNKLGSNPRRPLREHLRTVLNRLVVAEADTIIIKSRLEKLGRTLVDTKSFYVVSDDRQFSTIAITGPELSMGRTILSKTTKSYLT